MTHATDQFAQPRCPATSLKLPIGAWEYREELDPTRQARLIAAGWRVVGPALFKYTHQERVS